MHSALRTVAARHALKLVMMQELIDAAHAALDAGIYSYSLGELASQRPPTIWDSERLFVTAMEELGIKPPDRKACIDIVIDDAATRITEGATPIEDVIGRLF